MQINNCLIFRGGDIALNPGDKVLLQDSPACPFVTFFASFELALTMTLKLYGYVPSTCTLRVANVLAEKGLDYEMITVDVFAGKHKTEEYANEFHPFNKIPVLFDEEEGIRIYGMGITGP